MSSLLVDTNLWIYAIDRDSQFFFKAQTLLFESEFDLFTTSKNHSEFLAVVTRSENLPLSIPLALEVIQDISAICTTLYPNSHTFKTFKNLLAKYQPRGLKIHDFEIASIGIGHGISRLATVNRRDFAAIEEIEIVLL
jgi:predicted nucleic acid-binding protein